MSNLQLDYFINTLDTELHNFIRNIDKEKINLVAELILDAKQHGDVFTLLVSVSLVMYLSIFQRYYLLQEHQRIF